MYYTYSIKNLENGKFYIGSRTAKCMLNRKPEDDLGVEYFSSASDKELWQAIKDDKVKYTILQEYDDPKVCWKAEQQLIAFYWRFFGKDMSYNHSYISCNGDKIFSTSGYHHTSESIEKMKRNRKGKTGKKFSEEHKRKIGEAHKGEKHYLYGKHLSSEHKEKIREATEGKHDNFKGKHHSKESKQKIGETLKEKRQGKNNPSYGKVWLYKGIEQIYVNKSELDYYLSLGFKIGRKIYKWMTPDGEIIIMSKTPVTRFHPDWILVE